MDNSNITNPHNQHICFCSNLLSSWDSQVSKQQASETYLPAVKRSHFAASYKVCNKMHDLVSTRCYLLNHSWCIDAHHFISVLDCRAQSHDSRTWYGGSLRFDSFSITRTEQNQWWRTAPRAYAKGILAEVRKRLQKRVLAGRVMKMACVGQSNPCGHM